MQANAGLRTREPRTLAEKQQPLRGRFDTSRVIYLAQMQPCVNLYSVEHCLYRPTGGMSFCCSRTVIDTT